MYKIKQVPEDFVVKEILDFALSENGKIPVFLLKKRDYTTEDAVARIADFYHVSRKYIGYAGIKDRKAVTEQYISINVLRRKFEEMHLADLNLTFFGYIDEPIYTGRLKGNQFGIIIRNVALSDCERLRKNSSGPMFVPNLYGEQRFSKNNAEIGRRILKRDFKKAAELAAEGNGAIKDFLEKHPTDYAGGLRRLPLKISKLFVHSYQSELFNRAAADFLSRNKSAKNQKIPIVGFGTEFEDSTIKGIYLRILEEEGITLRDFIIRGIPELSSEGNERDLFAEVSDFKMGTIDADELNAGAKKVSVSFSLPKGCYATVAIEFLMR
jgi:tRNA pseudouridine13 synthase